MWCTLGFEPPILLDVLPLPGLALSFIYGAQSRSDVATRAALATDQASTFVSTSVRYQGGLAVL
ncbi:hypothetical protein ES707_20944 [subsurface metagenome]